LAHVRDEPVPSGDVAVPDVGGGRRQEEHERRDPHPRPARQRQHEDHGAGRDPRQRDDVGEGHAAPRHRRPQESVLTTSLLTHDRVSNTPFPSMAVATKSGTPIGLIWARSSSTDSTSGRSRLLYWMAKGIVSRS